MTGAEATSKSIFVTVLFPVGLAAAAAAIAVGLADQLSAVLALAAVAGVGVFVVVAASVPALAERPYLVPLIAGLVLIDFAGYPIVGYLLIGDVLLLLAFMLWRFDRTPSTVPLKHPTGLYICVGLYVVGTAIATPTAVDAGESLTVLLHFTFLFAVLLPMLVVFLAREPRAFAVVLPSVVVAGTAQALGVFYLTASGVDWSTGERINGVLGSEPQLLMVAGCLGGLSLLWFERGHPLLRVTAAGAVFLMATALAVMRFRAAWVALVVGVVVFLWTASPGRRAAGVMVGVLIAGAGWLAYGQGLLPGAIEDRLDQTFDASATDLDLRVESTAELAELFYENPLVGVGPGQSSHYLPAYFVQSRVGAAHNVVANAAVEGGVLAGVGLTGILIASIGLAAAAVHRTRDPDIRRVAVWALSSACGLAFGVQFVPTIYWRSFFVVLAMCATVSIVSRRSIPA